MTSRQTKRKLSEEFIDKPKDDKILILHNDDIHSFDYVTVALMEVCGHSFEQASQCTLSDTSASDVSNGRCRSLR